MLLAWREERGGVSGGGEGFGWRGSKVRADWFGMMDGRGTDLVWVVDSGWASPNLAALAVKKTLGLPATTCLVEMRLAGGFVCRLLIQAPSYPH